MSMETRPAPRDAAGEWWQTLPGCIGEIAIERRDAETIALFHRDDRGRDGLTSYNDAHAAMEIARSDDAGNFRPLKTAPNLRHGWILLLRSWAETRDALDYFYPARLAAFARWREGKLATTTLRETLNRQTGMYRVAAKITDTQSDALVADFCRSDGGCLRTILWKRDQDGAPASTQLPLEKFDPAFDQTGRSERALPLLCQEACNLLVAAARKAVKGDE